MGVQGLLSCCLYKQDQTVQKTDLVEIARKSRQGIEILVDYYCFQQLIMDKLWNGLEQLRNNPYLRILGGEYETAENFLRKFIQNLKHLNISLVFYVDPAPGCSMEALRQKMDTKISRHNQNMEKLNQIVDVCRGLKNMDEVRDILPIRPVCLEVQLFHVLKQCGCEIVQSLTGEADYLLAKDFYDREKAFAILSNDSDFCIFKDLRFIPHRLFDMDNDMKMGEPIDIPIKPEKLTCGVLTSSKVMEVFGFRSHHLLVELSIVGGNDFTGEIMRDGLRDKLDIRGKKGIENIAGWLRHYKNVENHPVLMEEMSHNKAFAAAVQHSRQFYNLQLPPEQPPRKGFYSQVLAEKILQVNDINIKNSNKTLASAVQHFRQFYNLHTCIQLPPEQLPRKGFYSLILAEKIQQRQYPIHLLAMHNNLYWHRTLLEDTTYGQPCAEVALAELRAHIYRIILPKQEGLVNEYGRSPWEPLRIAGIMAVEDPGIPPLHKIYDDKIFWNLKTFHHIMSHQNPGQETEWFNRYGRKTGFIVYLLRYFLQQNWGRNLHISQQEFLALIAMAFGRPKEVDYQQICLRPTPRCVTIGNWFQNLYRHAYLFLGRLLFLTQEFPLPHEVISGSTWTAFYMVCKDDSFHAAITQVPMHILRQVQEDMNNVIREKKHMIRYITEGAFYFDDRF
ncbi:hypothetical protein FSP39_002294 [Pinctada imbricata]|uniref:Uncharacterized protein n=1 Tax=Pinctada imbricata TaxID=66713 RepID=A0AA89BLM9_PINIB|nr:hypothetical protein FSP39_002294 [Pinctada imbricata]